MTDTIDAYLHRHRECGPACFITGDECPPPPPDYPEHEKLRAITDQSQAVGEFLDWLRSSKEDGGKGVHLLIWAEWEEPDACSRCGFSDMDTVGGRKTRDTCHLCDGTGRVIRQREDWLPMGIPTTDLLAEFFDIDQKKIEAEKRAMLAALRAAG